MAVDWRLGLQQTNPITSAYEAFQQGRTIAGERSAAQALATGNPQGALDAYATLGNAQGVERINTQQREQARRESESAWKAEQQGQQRQQWGEQDKERIRGNILRIAGAMRYAPPEGRLAMFQSEGIPALLEIGTPQADIDRILQNGISDQELNEVTALLGGEVPRPEGPKVIEGPDGIYTVGPDGTAQRVATYPEEERGVPAGMIRTPDGRLVWEPGYVEAQGQLSGVRREATVSRPMPRQGGGGGSGGGAASNRATPPTPGKPWERYR